MIIKSHSHHQLGKLVDPVGGEGINYVTKRLNHSGSIAVIGMTAGNTILILYSLTF